ncbi:hypothetical protein HDU91_004799 [Kappamyces sp. JEL0680]|nr:hypothetical protein HDU91_004799 [Kappamyces sp. JEL0680]
MLTASYQQSRTIDEFLRKEKVLYQKFVDEPKLLILGSSDSGKSTLLKQLKIMHRNGFTREELEEARSCIYAGIVIAITTLCSCCLPAQQAWLASHYGDAIDFLKGYHISKEEELVLHKQPIHELSRHPFVLAAMDTQTGLPDTTDFLSELDRILDRAYQPTDQDVLNVRTVTKSVSETLFTIKDTCYHFFDVSGLSHDRSHWVQYFDTVDTILFVASLASYDQFLVEDPTVNRMADSLVLFEQMINHSLLHKVPFVLFLNKKDLFKKKIKSRSLTLLFPDYAGTCSVLTAGEPGSANDACKFICNKFHLQAQTENRITFHVTCATDKASMELIIQKVM